MKRQPYKPQQSSPRITLADRNNTRIDSVYFQGSILRDSSSSVSRKLTDSFNQRKKDNQIAVLKHQLKNTREECRHYKELCTQLEQQLEIPVSSSIVSCQRVEELAKQLIKLQEDITGMQALSHTYEQELNLNRIQMQNMQMEHKNRELQFQNILTVEKARNQILEHQLKKANDYIRTNQKAYQEVLNSEREHAQTQRQELLKQIQASS